MKTAEELVLDIFTNASHETIRSFLEIECGFTSEEALHWLSEVERTFSDKTDKLG